MSMTVLQALNRVRSYLDDVNNGSDARWSDSEIYTALDLALDLVVNEAVQGGVHQNFRQTATSSLSAGIITVPANIKIISLFLSNGNARTAILPGPPRQRAFIDRASSGTVEIDYIAKNSVNWGTPSSTVTFGGIDIDDNVFDQYLIAIAAIELSVKEGEVNPVLMDRAEKYRKAILGTPVTGQISVFPSTRNILTPSSFYQMFYYKKSQTTLEVYR